MAQTNALPCGLCGTRIDILKVGRQFVACCTQIGCPCKLRGTGSNKFGALDAYRAQAAAKGVRNA